jgi:hypothetical protein
MLCCTADRQLCACAITIVTCDCAITQTARQNALRVEALLQSQESHQLSLAHVSVFQAKLREDDDACLPVSSLSHARRCEAALLPSPVTLLSACASAVSLSGPRSELACARASCNTFGSSGSDGITFNFVHQWCAGRATVQFGRNSFEAGVFRVYSARV